MTQQQMFERLKKEGECWHEIEYAIAQNCRYAYRCSCGVIFNLEDIDILNHTNPDLLSATGKLWMEERLLEREEIDDVFYEKSKQKSVKYICYIGIEKVHSYQYRGVGDTLPQALFNAAEEYFKEVG